MSVSPLLSSNAPPQARPEEIKKAASEFEAMWIETMLHSARPEAGATLTGEADSTRDMVLDLADQQIARMLSAQGGLGLARLVRDGFSRKPAGAPSEPVDGTAKR